MRAVADGAERIMVVLDSNHTRAHVLRELELYALLVTKDCYLVCVILSSSKCRRDRFRIVHGIRGNNPATAVEVFMSTSDRFEVDAVIDAKLQISVAPGGYLKCMVD